MTDEEQFERYDDIVIGRVSSREDRKDSTENSGFDPDEEIHFTIEKTLKWELSGSITLLNSTRSSCWITLSSGDSYLLYLSDNTDSPYYPAHYISMINVSARNSQEQSVKDILNPVWKKSWYNVYRSLEINFLHMWREIQVWYSNTFTEL